MGPKPGEGQFCPDFRGRSPGCAGPRGFPGGAGVSVRSGTVIKGAVSNALRRAKHLPPAGAWVSGRGSRLTVICRRARCCQNCALRFGIGVLMVVPTLPDQGLFSMDRGKCRAVGVDCEAGRALGCGTFCCRLLVRLKPHEIVPPEDGQPAKSFVDKDEAGYCVHFDLDASLCRIWERRPEACREYDCNGDFLLQVALKEGFTDIADLAKKARTAFIPKECYVRVPLSEDQEQPSLE